MSEPPESQRQDRQHAQGDGGILFNQIHKGVPGEKEYPTLLYGLGIGWKVLACKDGYFGEWLSRAEEVQDLFLAFKREFEYLHFPRDDHIKACPFVPFREYALAPFENLVRYNHGQLFLLFLGESFKQGNGSDVSGDFRVQSLLSLADTISYVFPSSGIIGGNRFIVNGIEQP
jgi:hypothetical protein